MDFRYSSMYKFYRNYGYPTDAVFVHMYEAVVKYNKASGTTSGPMAPFIVQSMQVRRIPTGDSLDHPTGTFLVSRKEDNDGCKRLYVVRPRVHDGIVTADHFSFHFNKGADDDSKLQLHQTFYLPSSVLPGSGYRAQESNFLPACFLIPRDVEDFKRSFLKNETINAGGRFLHDLMTRPVTDARFITVAATATLGGGRTRRVATFDDMWTALPIKRIMVVGVRNGHGFDVTVFVSSTLRPAESHSMFVRSDAERDFRADIARHFENYTRDSFRSYPDPLDDLDKDEATAS